MLGRESHPPAPKRRRAGNRGWTWWTSTSSHNIITVMIPADGRPLSIGVCVTWRSCNTSQLLLTQSVPLPPTSPYPLQSLAVILPAIGLPNAFRRCRLLTLMHILFPNIQLCTSKFDLTSVPMRRRYILGLVQEFPSGLWMQRTAKRQPP